MKAKPSRRGRAKSPARPKGGIVFSYSAEDLKRLNSPRPILLSADINFQIPEPKFETTYELIKLSLALFFKSFWFIAKVTLLVAIPWKLIQYFLANTAFVSGAVFSNIRAHSDIFLNSVLGPLIELMIIFGVASFLKFKKFPSVIDSCRFASHKWARLTMAELGMGLVCFLASFLLVIPGIYLLIAYFLIVPVICFEGMTVKSLLMRSREVTFKCRNLILVTVVVLIVLFMLLLFVSYAVMLFFFILWKPESFTQNTDLVEPIFDFALGCVSFVWADIVVVASLLIYLKFRNNDVKNPEEWWPVRWAP
jgi:hypothetical protein